MDKARARLRHVDQLDRQRPVVGRGRRLDPHRQARRAIAALALFGGKLLQQADAVDLFVEGDAAAALFGPDDAPGQDDVFGERNLQPFALFDRDVGRQHHAAVGNIAHPPQAGVILTFDLGDAADGAEAIGGAAIGFGFDIL